MHGHHGGAAEGEGSQNHYSSYMAVIGGIEINSHQTKHKTKTAPPTHHHHPHPLLRTCHSHMITRHPLQENHNSTHIKTTCRIKWQSKRMKSEEAVVYPNVNVHSQNICGGKREE